MNFEILQSNFKDYVMAKYSLTLEEYEQKYSSENSILESDFKIKNGFFIGAVFNGYNSPLSLLNDINNLNKETLRTTFSLVNQFPYIFDMTIKENLLLAKPDATDEELTQAIKLSALDSFINSLPTMSLLLASFKS